MRRLALLSALFVVVSEAAAIASPVKIKVEDSAGAVVKNVLVIVQDLDKSRRETLRVLSDEDGKVPVLQLSPGLYRVIATAPYGLWQTGVRELLVGQQPTNLIIKVQAQPTRGYGDVVTLGTTQRHFQVIGPDGQPASGARILIRDRDATPYLERWYMTDDSGIAKIDLIGDPTVAVVIYADVLLTTEIAQRDSSTLIHMQKH